MEAVQEMLNAAIMALNSEPLSDKEYIEMKCRTFNEISGNLNDIDGYNCDKCRNKGFIAETKLIGNEWSEIHCECSCRKIRRAVMRLIKSGLKNIIKEYTFDNFKASEKWQTALKEAAVRYAQNPEGWLFIGGQSGSGKTHLCTAAAGYLLNSGKEVKYMLWRDDVTRLKGCISNDSDEYHNLISSYKTAEVLYIDDLFKNGKGNDGRVQAPTGADIQIAFEILNYRYNNRQLATIISSERSLYDLIAIDEAVASRISEMSFDKGFCFNIKADIRRNFRLRNISEL